MILCPQNINITDFCVLSEDIFFVKVTHNYVSSNTICLNCNLLQYIGEKDIFSIYVHHVRRKFLRKFC